MDECIKNLLFCTDLINYLMEEKNKAVYLNEELKDHMGKSQFDVAIGKAVLLVSSKERKEADQYIKSQKTKPSKKEICRWVMSQWCKYLDPSFCPDRFIYYCGLVFALIESYYDKYNDLKICGVLANALCSRLDGFMLFGVLKENERWWNSVNIAADNIVQSNQVPN